MIVHWMRRDGPGRTLHAFWSSDSAIPLKALCGYGQWPQDLTHNGYEVRGPVVHSFCRKCFSALRRHVEASP